MTGELGGGGAEKVLVTLATEFARRGYDVDLVLLRKRGLLLNSVPSNVRVVNLKWRRPSLCLVPFLLYLRKAKPKLVLSTLLGANILALLAKKFFAPSMGVFVREAGHFSTVSKYRPTGRRILARVLVRLCYRWADKVIAVSNGVAKDLLAVSGLDRDQVCTIYNPTYTPDIETKAQQLPQAKCYHTANRPIILGAGRITWDKGFDILVRAFEILRSERPATLVIIGERVPDLEGGCWQELTLLIEELGLSSEVHLLGFQENPFPYFSHSDLFVLSSRVEGLPSVLIQALACGTPVVATDCESGPREILAEGAYGKLVAVDDVAALSDAMRQTLNVKPNRAILIGRAREFDMERALQKYAEVMGLSL